MDLCEEASLTQPGFQPLPASGSRMGAFPASELARTAPSTRFGVRQLAAGLPWRELARGRFDPGQQSGLKQSGRKLPHSKKMLKIYGTNSLKSFRINKSVKKTNPKRTGFCMQKGLIQAKKAAICEEIRSAGELGSGGRHYPLPANICIFKLNSPIISRFQAVIQVYEG